MSKKTKNRIFLSQITIGFSIVMLFLALVIIISFDADSDALETGLIFSGIAIVLLGIGIYAYKRYKVIAEQESKDGKRYIDEDDDEKLN